MNNILIIGALLAVVAVGGGVYVVSQNSAQNEDSAVDTMSAEEQKEEVQGSFTGTVSQLLALGQNITCTFAQTEESTTVDGTVYLAASGERMRGDFTATSEGQSMNGSVIRRDGVNYTWGETPFGTFATKVVDDDTDESTATQKDKNTGVDFDENIEYSCRAWQVDESTFELPAGVVFDDINAQVNEVNAASGQVRDLQCGACDNIPDAAAQSQCKAALGCS